MNELQTTSTELIASAPAQYSINNAASLKNLATELAQFVKEKKMTTTIQGREYVHVEAWTFAGLSIGLTPIVAACVDISRPGHMVGAKGQERQEVRYSATVELLNVHTGQTVGRAFAICSNEEAKKKFFDEYSIASMAQTRATGKVYRLPLGWLMQAAGFQATPAEEMDSFKEPTLGVAVDELEAAADLPALAATWNRHKKQFGTHTVFAHAKEMRKAALQPAPAASPNAPHLASSAQLELLDNLLKSSSVADISEQLREKMREPGFTMQEASTMIEQVNAHLAAAQQAQRF